MINASVSAPGDLLLAYLEISERLVTAIEDPGIEEQALGGDIDTCVRSEVHAQIKVAPITGLTPEQAADAFATILAPAGTAVLGVASATPVADPCDLPTPGGYTGPENRLYRLEAHGPRSGAMIFKWSNNNGADLFRAAYPPGLPPGGMASAIAVTADTDLKDGDLVELLSDAIDFGDDAPGALDSTGFTKPNRAVGRLLRLSGGQDISGVDRLFELLDPIDETPVTDIDSGRFGVSGLKLRRWSGLIQHTADDTHSLEAGVQAQISGAFAPGDWFQFEARTGAANANGPVNPEPHGPERLFAPLAVFEQTVAGAPMILRAWLDHRFPKLCSLHADDVAYDGDRRGVEAETVQEAIDDLYTQESAGCGEIFAPPDRDLRDVIDEIPAGGDAKICLGPGERDLPGPVVIEGKGNIVITGIGGGTVLRAGANRLTLHIRDCESISLDGFRIETAGAGEAVIRIENCAYVDLEGVQIISDGDANHGEAALRINSQGTQFRCARVRKCDVRVGLRDTGIQIVGARDASVTGLQSRCEVGRVQRRCGGVREQFRLRSRARLHDELELQCRLRVICRRITSACSSPPIRAP